MDNGGRSGTNIGSNYSINDKYRGFNKLCEKNPSTDKKSELEMYLEEPRFPRTTDFCILHWRKVDNAKYPILAKIARDVLATPTTIIASESSFSIGVEELLTKLEPPCFPSL